MSSLDPNSKTWSNTSHFLVWLLDMVLVRYLEATYSISTFMELFHHQEESHIIHPSSQCEVLVFPQVCTYNMVGSVQSGFIFNSQQVLKISQNIELLSHLIRWYQVFIMYGNRKQQVHTLYLLHMYQILYLLGCFMYCYYKDRCNLVVPLLLKDVPPNQENPADPPTRQAPH